MESDILEFYLQPGPRTGLPEGISEQFPEDIAGIVARIQKLIVHIERVRRDPPPSLDLGSNFQKPRSVEEVFSKITVTPLPSELPAEERVICICRNFAMMLTGVLRAKGIPARSRCGFAIYFDLGYYEDHWICEYWDRATSRWTRVDAQIDDYWRKWLHLDAVFFDNLNVRKGQFFSGGELWKLYRAGVVSADICGFSIPNDSGEYYVRGNMLRDFFALNNIEYTYQETSRLMEKDTVPNKADLNLLDEISGASSDPDGHFEELRSLYDTQPQLRPAGLP